MMKGNRGIRMGSGGFGRFYRRYSVSIQLFLLTILEAAIAPAVYAAAGEEIARKTAWALGLLGLTVIALSVYLFWVIFEPERF